MTTLGPMPDSSPLPPNIAAIRRRLVDRFDDLRWCNKDDECHTGAEWLSLAISDLDAEVRDLRAALAATPDTLDVERLAWAMHLVEQHGARGARGATPCYHDRSTSAWPNGPAIVAEYARLREDRS